jgi:integral membrane protein (TIGR01906 family)
MNTSRMLLISILPLAILLGSAYTIIFNQSWYEKEFEKLRIYDSFDKEKQEIKSETAKIIFFLKGKSDLNTEFLNEKEKIHMQDVRSIVKKYQIVTYLVVLATLTLLFFTRKDKKALLYAGFSALVCLGVFLVIIATMFSAVFITFHEIFFTNDFWMLNPETDNLIKLFPEQFFIDAIKRMIKESITISIMFIVVGSYRMYGAMLKQKVYINKKVKKKNDKSNDI